MLLSIIMPAYNASSTVGAAIESVLAQSLDDFELIVIDDGSTDATASIIDRYASVDERVRVRHTENGGQAMARNVGLDMARGKYIGFMDADDLLEVPDMLEKYTDYMDSHPDTDVMQFPALWKSESGEKMEGQFDKSVSAADELALTLLSRELTGIVWDKIYRRELFDKVKFTPGRYFEDSWLVMDLLPHIRRLDFYSYGYYTYLFRDGSEMNSRYNQKKWGHLLERNLRFLSLFPDDKRRSALYLEHYSIVINHLCRFAKEHGFDKISRYSAEAAKKMPTLKTVISNTNDKSLLKKFILLKLLGINNYIRIAKRHYQ